ncbi:MAG: histidine kinase dimerization/phosphoacceptor domain -containing protein, partial [Methanoregula sp.]|nr:histidine kinase dimerization/phosphoacceptor domain -containing protein [Methanoregula sp.]
FYIININQVATDTAISSYQETELEIVREAARGVEEYVYVQTEVLGRNDISAIEQEIYTKLIDPIQLLKNGDAWIYAPDHIVFDESADLPKEYWGKSMAQIFALQQKNGASHYEEMTADVSHGREGVGYYVWLPEKGPEIAAWTPVRVGNNTWTIGLSTPLPEILEASGASSQIAMTTAVILFSTTLALILLSLWLYSDLKRKQVHEELRESEERFRLLFQNANDGIFVHEISPEGPGKFIDANEQACRLLGYTHDEMAHMSVGNIDVPEQFERIPAITEQLIKGGHAVFETGFLTKDKERIPVEVSARLFDLRGKQTVLAIIHDITGRKAAELQLQRYNVDLEKGIAERTASLHMTIDLLQNEVLQHEIAEKKLQESLDEKSIFLKEIHHRVKNNLQIIASLLNLQSRYITDEKTLQAIKDSQSRVKAMALVHERLYRSSDISNIDLGDYIKFLGNSLFDFLGAKGKGILFKPDICDIFLDINSAINLGLIVNELISNSLKHAFPGGRRGEITISAEKKDHTISFVYRDNGVGIPEDFDWRNAESLGLRLVCSLVDQLDGTIELDRTAGTAFTIIVTEKE